MATEAAVKVPARPTRTPGRALLLSLLWPGLGQIYNGQARKGIPMMALYGVALLLIISQSPLGFVMAALLLVFGSVTAHSVATRYERWIGGPQKLCPHCGESVQTMAQSCRFCGWNCPQEA